MKLSVALLLLLPCLAMGMLREGYQGRRQVSSGRGLRRGPPRIFRMRDRSNDRDAFFRDRAGRIHKVDEINVKFINGRFQRVAKLEPIEPRDRHVVLPSPGFGRRGGMSRYGRGFSRRDRGLVGGGRRSGYGVRSLI